MHATKIIIPTCDKYRNLLEANKFMMDKLCPDFKVVVLGYKQPDFNMGEWEFVSLGSDPGAGSFANSLPKFFDSFDDEYFIYGNDDGITTSFDNDFFNEILEIAKDTPDFGRAWLIQGSSAPGEVPVLVKDFGEYQVARINQESKYRLSLQCSLWKTSYFKKYLLPNISPWEWELRDNAKNDGAVIMIPINKSAITLGHVMRSFNKSKPEFLKGWNKSIYGEERLDDGDTVICENMYKKHGYHE